MAELHLSRRAEELMEQGKTNVLGKALFKVFSSQYSPSYPEGVVCCGLAENSLCHDWLAAFFEKSLRLSPADFTYGDSLLGSQRLSAALGTYYASHLLPLTPVLPSHIATANGLTHLLDQLSAVLCDAGEAFILPTPFYNAFPEDFGRRSGVRIVGVEIGEWLEGSLGEVKALEAEMRRRKGTGEPAVRAVVVTNPSNPLGFCYDKDVLLEYARFAERWNVYLIVDEIYAQSVYSSDLVPQTSFTSILSLDVPCDPARIIQLYGMSKDFGANGFRIGVAVIQHNPRLYGALCATAGISMKIGSPADALWSALLTSPELPTYLALNRTCLAEAYSFATTWLRSHDIPYRPANAGHFVVIDLRRFLAGEGDGKAREVALLERFVDAGVYLGPGFSYFVKEAGFFRLTFSIARPALVVGLQRVEEVLGLASNGSLGTATAS